MSERVSVAETAKRMGVSTQFVRLGMQRGALPIGCCVKVKNRWNYYISPALLEQYVTKKMQPAATDCIEDRSIYENIEQKGQLN